MIEIERKFLTRLQDWPAARRRIAIRQGYLASSDRLVCRVRQKDDIHFLSVKAGIDVTSSYDFEYPVPADDGNIMLEKLCERPPLSKTRHEIELNNLVWEIDVFHGLNEGLVVAEIELPRSDMTLALPAWLGAEVTEDTRYRNSQLYWHPWQQWGQTG